MPSSFLCWFSAAQREKVKGPGRKRSFQRDCIALVGCLVGLALEGSLVGSCSKRFLLNILSIKHWKGLLPRSGQTQELYPSTYKEVPAFCVEDTGVSSKGFPPSASQEQ